MTPQLVSKNVQIDFGSVKGTLPYNIVPSDIDGLIEINGFFLLIETKFDKAPLSTGQRRMLQALSHLEQFTVVVVSIDKQPTTVPGMYSFAPNAWYFIRNGVMGQWSDCDLVKFNRLIQQWYQAVTVDDTAIV